MFYLLQVEEKYYLFYKCYWNSCRISKCKFYSNIFSDYRNNKETVKNNKKEKEKIQKIVRLAKSKLNIIETLMSQALIDLNISHGEFKTIVNGNEKYEQMKENIRNAKSRDELSENSRDIRENRLEKMEIHRLKKIFFCFVCVKWLN